MTFEELLSRIDSILAKNQEGSVTPCDITSAAAIVFSHWNYTMEQTRLDVQIAGNSSIQELLTTQRSMLDSLKSTPPEKPAWMP